MSSVAEASSVAAPITQDGSSGNIHVNDVGANDEIEGHLQKKKRAKTSPVWNEFKEEEIEGKMKARCIHCKHHYSIMACGTTTHLKRHLETCPLRKKYIVEQQRINFPPTDSKIDFFASGSALTDGRFDMMKMRETLAHWILMNEHPFSIVEEAGFNLFARTGMMDWNKISRNTIKKDCEQVYEGEKKKLKAQLRGVNKISLTTDLWKSTNQKIGYMVLTGHFIDSEWKLQKRVLNFVHLPPPHRGVEIADVIFKCLEEWGIENKVYTLSVDNASSNDSAVRILKDSFSRSNSLLCEGKLFHVRYCAHILNLMVQDGISQIKHIIDDVHESVTFINQTEGRLRTFSQIVQLLHLPQRRLILDCKTRWNSTYEMLVIAAKLKDAFSRFQVREPTYDCCPTDEDWIKVEKVCQVLGVFASVTKVISGSEYPTSNLYLTEICKVKEMLDKKSRDVDDFIRNMTCTMKLKFDKYWGDCNMLMAIASVLDPRGKILYLQYSFSQMYSTNETRENLKAVRDLMNELYKEYEKENISASESSSTTMPHGPGSSGDSIPEASNWSAFYSYMRTLPAGQKSELDCYLDESCYVHPGDPTVFDVLSWWKEQRMKYPILSKMARDIIAIPIATVASESTFSAGSRVIDSYRSSLKPETVQVLLCGGDWCRSIHGVKKNSSVDKQSVEIDLS